MVKFDVSPLLVCLRSVHVFTPLAAAECADPPFVHLRDCFITLRLINSKERSSVHEAEPTTIPGTKELRLLSWAHSNIV